MIKIIIPNGGERWSRGSKQTIQWSADQSITHVNIFLEPPPCVPSPGQTCAGFAIKAIPIAYNIPSTGTFDWTIRYDTDGKDIAPGKYLVRIEELPFSPNYRYDYSDVAFDIE